ncbi:MAG: methylenetetrahydrofolate reductase [NAD(P)H] [Actinomycetia bacterium]|nr:methylenetetrahydrofolate reductase [NAD(P)H] [Actinomycetes bacterium]MCP4959815.1 methylenetetrahydrofolate reductase [NAD(P)H] [Actinomycetes bacterium]
MAARLGRRPWPASNLRPGFEVSFEFFPAATDAGEQNLVDTASRLADFDPAFVSVTYGAGGTTQERTLNSIRRLKGETNLDVAGHLTCVGASAAEVHEVLDVYAEAGVRRVVALRGDPPEGESDGTRPDGYRSATELVQGIRARSDGDSWDISVAAYPEIHPKAVSPSSDLDNLKRKIDAGADRALTQFFFDTDAFLRFLDTARAAGITAPIVPGIMPVTNFEKTAGFSGRCGTSIPAWMSDLFGGVDDVPEVQQMIAATVAAEQCRRIAEHGVQTFHFYTMNRIELTLALCKILGVGAAAQAEPITSGSRSSIA